MAAAPLPGNEDGSLWSAVVTACGVIVQLIIAIGSFVWTLARSKNATDDKIAEKDKAVTADMIALERRFADDIETVRHEVGETVTALAHKLTQTELWNRDHFVDKETFREMRQDLKALGERVDERFDRLERKLDATGPRRSSG